MKKYTRKNRGWFMAAWICILASNFFAVILQFFKGDVLDFAIQGATKETIKYAILLISFILCEIFFIYNITSFQYTLKNVLFQILCASNYISCLKNIVTIIKENFAQYKRY